MITYYIFHLDDEPLLVDWLPSVVYNHIVSMLDSEARYSEVENPGVNIVQVDFNHPAQGSLQLVYELHEAKEHFLERIASVERCSTVLYIFDLNLIGDGEAGAKVARQILEKTTGDGFSPVDWFYLTGFPEEAESALGALNLGGKVVAKPPNSADLAADIYSALEKKIQEK